MHSDSQIKYYTEFDSYLSFKTFFDGLPSPCAGSRWTALSPLDEFLLAMMKLRHDFGFMDLGVRFWDRFENGFSNLREVGRHPVLFFQGHRNVALDDEIRNRAKPTRVLR